MTYWEMSREERELHHDAYLDAEYETMQQRPFDKMPAGHRMALLFAFCIGIAIRLALLSGVCIVVYMIGKVIVG